MSSIQSNLYRLLRRSERYTKTDMVYLAKGGFWSIAAQVAASLSTFALAVVVAHFLSKEVYGQYKYLLASVALLSSLSLTGLGTAVFQSVARGFDGALVEGFWLNLRWSALAFLGAFASAAYYFTHGNTTLALGLLIGGSLSPLLASANLAGVFLNAKKEFGRGARYFGIIETLFDVGALIVTILFTQNPLILASVYFASNTLATYLLYRRVVRLYRPSPTNTDPNMLTYAKHLSLMGVLAIIAGNIDQVLLFHFVGPIQLALYNFAIAIPDQLKGPLKGLDQMIQTKFVGRTDREIRAGMKNKMLWLALASVAFIALYILFAPYFYAFFFPNYSDAVFYSQLYALSLLGLLFAPSGSYLSAKKKVREQYISTLVSSLFQIGILVLGVINAGLFGLILARIVIRIGGAAFAFLLYRTSTS